MEADPPMPGAALRPPGGDALAPLALGAAASGAGLCLTDAADVIRYMNPAFRISFCPLYDGRPAPFMEVIGAAIRDGTGIRLDSAPPHDFNARVTARRRGMTGELCFATDTMDGRWWWVSDTKLPDGGILAVAQNISALKREEFALRDAHASAVEEAQTDELTGVANRRGGLRLAEAAVAEAHTSHAFGTAPPLAVALMDIDHFKAINDRHGHDGGDRAIRHFARFLASVAAPGQHFCRLGGDEFLLVAPRLDGPALERALASALGVMPPLLLAGAREGLKLGISVGVASLAPGEAWPDLLRRADQALYDAKAAGRGRIALAA